MTQKRIKILYAIKTLEIGGAEKLLLNTVRCLDREKFEPVVCVLMPRRKKKAADAGDLMPFFQQLGIKMIPLAMRHKLDFGVINDFKRVLLEEQPDILHSHLLHADFLARIWGKKYGVPVVVSTIHMLEFWRHWWPFNIIDRWTSQFNDRLMAVSEEVKDGVVQVQRYDDSQIDVLPNAIDFCIENRAEVRRTKRASLNMTDDQFLVGIVSRLEEPRKGHWLLIEAVGRLASAWPGLRCVIVGDGPARQSLEERVKKLSLEKIVTFTGMQSRVEQWLAAMDLFALPSYLEGSPLCLIEAMAAGLPIVATSVGGIPKLIEHNQSGLLIQPGNVKDLADAISQMMNHHAEARDMGQAAREVFNERFDMQRIVKRQEEIYLKLFNEKNSRRVKLLEVVTSFDAGGVTTHLVNLLRHFPRDRFDVRLASGREDFQSARFESLGIPHYSVGLVKAIQPFEDLKALWQLIRLIRKEKFDVVHTHMAKADWIAGLAARLCGVKSILSTAHGPTTVTAGPSLVQTIFDGIERWTYRSIHHQVISVSQSTTQHLLSKRAVRPENIVTVLNGIDLDPDLGDFDRNRLRRDLGIDSDQPVIIMVGRLKYPKAPDVLIRSMKYLLKRQPKLLCLVVGEGPDRKYLEPMIAENGLTNSVKLLGARQDVRQLLRISDAFILSSYSEGLSMSVLEAMAAGLPVLATSVGGMCELVDHGTTGFLIKAGDDQALAEAIANLFENSDRRKTLAEATLRRVKKYFDCQVQSEKTQGIILKSLRRSKPKVKVPSKSIHRFKQISLFYREEGFRKTVKRLLKFAITPFYRYEYLWFLVRTYFDWGSGVKTKFPCTIRRATLDDVDRLSGLFFGSRELLAAQLSSPREACFIAEYEGQAVAIQWVRLGMGDADGFTIYPFKYCVKLARDEAYLHDARTLKAFRGRGAILAIEEEIYRSFPACGYRTFYTDILPDNLISLNTFEKLGFRKFEHVKLKRIFGRIRVFSEHPRLEDEAPIQVLFLTVARPTASSALNWAMCLNPESFQTVTVARPVCRHFFFLWRLMRRKRFEIVHCDDLSQFIFGGLIARLAGVKHRTLTLRESDPWLQAKVHWLRSLARWFLRKADLVFFESPELKQRWIENKWIREEQTDQLSQNISLADFNGQLSTEEARRRLDIRSRGLVVGTVIPLVDEINPWRFLDLCHKLKKQIPDCHFIVAGDGPFFRTFKHYVDTSQLSESLHFLRKGYEGPVVLKALDLFVDMKNPADGSLPKLQAMASSKAVVAMDRRGMRNESVEHYFDSRTATEAEVKRVLSILGQPLQIEALGRMNHSEVESCFQERYRAAQYAVAWNKLLASDLFPMPADHWRKKDDYSTFSRKPL